ncbi:MAG: hypothetical protein JF609_12355 [Verrucomicrobia bacterium]|nr:hypothetical protein [Verrucomicrobiota bacterium]
MPEVIREQVNQRLANHESSTPLLAWLNARPEVREVMAQEFGGRPVDRNNMSEWRRGGFKAWQEQQAAEKLMVRLSADGHEFSEMDAGAVLGTMTTFAAAQYLVAMKNPQGPEGQGGQGGEASSFKRLREFCGDLATLRRGEQMADRLEFERERLAWWREKWQVKAPGVPPPNVQPPGTGQQPTTNDGPAPMNTIEDFLSACSYRSSVVK